MEPELNHTDGLLQIRNLYKVAPGEILLVLFLCYLVNYRHSSAYYQKVYILGLLNFEEIKVSKSTQNRL